MNHTGWVLIHRSLMDSKLYLDSKPFSKAFAWIDLILLANHKDAEKDPEGLCRRGNVDVSIRWLSEHWGWDYKKTYEFLKYLEKNSMVVVRRSRNGSSIHLVNYDRYQNPAMGRDENLHHESHHDFHNGFHNVPSSDINGFTESGNNGFHHGSHHEPHTHNKINNMKEEYIPPVVPRGDDGRFDRFWEAYPKKVGKGEARKAFARLKVSGELLDRMLAALTRQRVSDQWNRENGRFIPNPATWLNQERWSDELKGPVVRVQPVNPAANFSQRVWEDDPDDMERFMKGPVILK